MAFSVTKEEEMVILMEAVCVLNMISWTMEADLSVTEEKEMVILEALELPEVTMPVIVFSEVPYDSMMEAVVE